MKINEVERLVGITKGNIRFYEKEGLLTPGRNNENGYREYSQADVEWLKKIRLLRMLDVPIEEILRLKSGDLTLEDAMGRHIIQLERQQSNLAAMGRICQQLREEHCRLDTLDTDRLFAYMEERQQEGAKFMDVKKKDKRVKYVAPFVAAFVTVIFMGLLIVAITWGILNDPEAPMWLIVLVIIPLVVMLGVLGALYQRVKEIRGGEEDAAAQY